MIYFYNKKGFTLIELLVVISIISLLSSVILVSLSSARKKAMHARYAVNMLYLRTALEMYRNDHGGWPGKADDGRMAITNDPSNPIGYTTFYNAISPYMPGFKIDFPYILSGGLISQGFMFFRGTELKPVRQTLYNGVTGDYLGCVTIYDGYFMNLLVPYGQSSFTLNDNGIDPDGIDHLDGKYTLDPSTPVAICSPTSPTLY